MCCAAYIQLCCKLWRYWWTLQTYNQPSCTVSSSTVQWTDCQLMQLPNQQNWLSTQTHHVSTSKQFYIKMVSSCQHIKTILHQNGKFLSQILSPLQLLEVCNIYSKSPCVYIKISRRLAIIKREQQRYGDDDGETERTREWGSMRKN